MNAQVNEIIMIKRPHSPSSRVACDTGVTARAMKWTTASMNANGMRRLMSMDTNPPVSMSRTGPTHYTHFANPRS